MNAPLPRLKPADAARDDRLRICFPFSGDSIGGSHISVRGLIEQLDPALYRPMVVTEVPGGMIASFFAGHERMDDSAAQWPFVPRSGERRVGKECVRSCICRWSPHH